MKTFRLVVAAPFACVGLGFLGLAALILGNQHVNWFDRVHLPPHH